MAKYYVQSGNVRSVIAADDAEKAALWVVHQAMQQVVPVYEDEGRTPEQKSELTAAQGIMVLGYVVATSEIGFDRDDATQLETFELVMHWHQLMAALAKLDSILR